jgi:hypothetical protein
MMVGLTAAEKLRAEGANSALDVAGPEILRLRDEIVALERKLASLDWTPITPENVPQTGALCLIVWADTVQTVAYRRVGLGFACRDGYVWEPAHGEGDCIPDGEVTHWQPLPNPPEHPAPETGEAAK